MHVVVVAPGVETRVPVLKCADSLLKGATVEVLGAESDSEVDAALATAAKTQARLIVAGGDGPLRAVVRRMARGAAPPTKQRPADLGEDRTMYDLPPIGLLPLELESAFPSLATALNLPTSPSNVAEAVLNGKHRRLDLFRNDGGSLTLHGVMLGEADEAGRPVPWRGRVEVDDKLLSDGDEHILACAIANASGYGRLAELPLITEAAADDGSIRVGLATPTPRKAKNQSYGVEVRRAYGRAVSISPREPITYTDDGVDGKLARKQTWWVERGAWAIYTRAATLNAY